MKYVSALLMSLAISTTANAKTGGEIIMDLGNQWANQPQGGYVVKQHQAQPNYLMQGTGRSATQNMMLNMMMQGMHNQQNGAYGNTYNNDSDSDE